MINKYFLAKMNIPAYLKKFLYDRYGYNEIEGIPPIIFNGNGKYLLDYRIYGAVGGVGDRTENLFDKKNTEIIHAYFSPENLWQVNDDSSSIIIKVRPNTQYTLSIGTAISIFRIYKTSLENPVPGNGDVFTPIIRSTNIKEYTFTTDNNTTYIIFQGTNADTEMWINSLILNIGSTSLPSYEPYGYKVPVVVNGKNLLQNMAITQTINGVSVIVNNDGSIKLSGTSTAITYIDINTNFNSTEFQDCYLNPFYPNNFVSSASTVLLRISNKTNRNSIQDFLSNSVIRDNGSNLRLAIRIGQNYTFSNDFVISPMISKFSDNTYEPYIEPTTTNIYLDEPIEENESISLSDTNVNIPTIRGTNVLTVDTTIQPSKVLIKV